MQMVRLSLAAPLAVLMLLVLGVGPAPAQQGVTVNTQVSVLVQTDPVTGGVTNWKEGFIQATGRGGARRIGHPVAERLNALKAARVNAFVKLAQTLKGVKVDAAYTVEDSIAAGSLEAARVDAFVRGAVTVEEKVNYIGDFPEGVVTLRVCLYDTADACARYGGGAGFTRVAGDALRQSPGQVSRTEILTGGGSGTGSAGGQQISGNGGGQQVASIPPGDVQPVTETATGAIFALNNLDFIPVLRPQVMSESGTLVYGASTPTHEAFVKYGAAQMTESVATAQSLELLGAAPMVIPVLRVTEQNDLIISDRDAGRLAAANVQGAEFLKDARVAIAFGG